MIDIQQTTTAEELTEINSSNYWHDITCALISYYTDIGKPFSSGEISAKIRVYRPDMVFSALSLGDVVRKYFNSGAFGLNRFNQYERATTSGQTVFVYAPNKWSGENYDFECVVPPPTPQQILNKVHNNITTNINQNPIYVGNAVVTQQNNNLWTVSVSGDGRLKLRKGLVQELLNKLGQQNKLLYTRSSSKSGLGIVFTTDGKEECKVEKDGRVRIAGFKHLQPGSQLTVSLEDLVK